MNLGVKSIIVAALLIVVMGVEAAIIYLVIPPQAARSATEAPGDGGGGSGTSASGTSTGASDGTAAPLRAADFTDDLEEVNVETFNTTNTKVSPGSVVHISFKLTALVHPKQKVNFDESVSKKYRSRTRQVVERVIRGATLDELQDPHLATLKRLIREEINKTLNSSSVVDVVLHDFRQMEQ